MRNPSYEITNLGTTPEKSRDVPENKIDCHEGKAGTNALNLTLSPKYPVDAHKFLGRKPGPATSVLSCFQFLPPENHDSRGYPPTRQNQNYAAIVTASNGSLILSFPFALLSYPRHRAPLLGLTTGLQVDLDLPRYNFLRQNLLSNNIYGKLKTSSGVDVVIYEYNFNVC